MLVTILHPLYRHPTCACHYLMLTTLLHRFFFLTLFKINFKSNTVLIFFLPKLTFLGAPIFLARRNACAAPCMVARQEVDVATTGSADR